MRASLLFLLLLSVLYNPPNSAKAYRDEETGEFITRDPAGFADGPNLYAYVGQNPWTKFDPEGLAAELVIRKPDDYDRVAKLQASGYKLYEGVKLVKGFDKDGNANGAWAAAQRLNGAVDSDGHRYTEGKLAGANGIWFFDNKEHAQAVQKNFNEYTWISIGGEVASTALSAGFSGLAGIAPEGPSGSAQFTRAAAQEQVEAATTELTKSQRLDRVYQQVSKAPTAKTAQEAMQQMHSTLDGVEDAFSGVEKNPNPTKPDGRMYPAQADRMVTAPDGTITATSRGHVTTYGANGSITVTERSTGTVVFKKPGGG